MKKTHFFGFSFVQKNDLKKNAVQKLLIKIMMFFFKKRRKIQKIEIGLEFHEKHSKFWSDKKRIVKEWRSSMDNVVMIVLFSVMIMLITEIRLGKFSFGSFTPKTAEKNNENQNKTGC